MDTILAYNQGMLTLSELYKLLPVKQLERLAVTYELDSQHQIKLSGPVVFLCLLNGLLNHVELSQRLLAATYDKITGFPISQSSISKCLARIPYAYFADLFVWLRKRLAPQIPNAGAMDVRVRRVDATTVTLSAKLLHWGLLVGTRSPDKARRHVKSVFSLEPDALPNFLHLCSTPAENADSVALGETMRLHSKPGDLWVFDKGCHGRKRLFEIHQQKAYFLTPLSQQSIRETQVLFEIKPTHLPTQPVAAGDPDFVVTRVYCGVFYHSRDSQQTRAEWEQMPLILVEGLRFDQRTQTWKPLTLMTNLPVSADQRHAGPYTFVELAQVYRSRWDMEVLFKFLKQHLSYSHLISRCENGIRVMIYLTLITALLLIWYRQKTGISQGWRVVKFWFAEDVRQWTQRAVRASRLVPG
jgi:hypothetical protein